MSLPTNCLVDKDAMDEDGHFYVRVLADAGHMLELKLLSSVLDKPAVPFRAWIAPIRSKHAMLAVGERALLCTVINRRSAATVEFLRERKRLKSDPLPPEELQ